MSSSQAGPVTRTAAGDVTGAVEPGPDLIEEPTGETAAPPARGQLAVLVASQLLAGVGVASGVAVGGVLAEKLTGTTALAGLAQTSSVLGAGIWAIPLARLAQRRGRRWGLGTGYALAVLGAATIMVAAALGWVPLMFVGFAGFGAATAAGLQARFAATEVVRPAFRARAMSIVLWSTTIGSVAGPNLSSLGFGVGQRFGIEPLTGPYLFSLLGFAAALVIIGLALHPQVEAGAGAGAVAAPTRMLPALRVALRNRVTVLAVVAITCSHTVMVGVMVMTPVHMIHDGFTLELVGLVISVHILGMYGASPLFGWLTDKITARWVLVIAVVIFAVALVVAGTSGSSRFATMSIALGLLGLGWSAGMIGGSTLLTESVPQPLRRQVQGSADAIMNVAAASSAALSGLIMGRVGYPGLAVVAAVVVVPMAILVIRSLTTRSEPAPTV